MATSQYIQFKIPDQLLIPFGAPKWVIDGIAVVGVSTTGTYIQSETPLAHIDKSKQVGLRLRHFKDIFPGEWPIVHETAEAADFIRKHLHESCEIATDSERRFLDLYFEYCREKIQVGVRVYSRARPGDRSDWPTPYNDDDWIFDALLPLPQAHLYETDPLSGKYTFVPSRMMKVDFAFWTGKRLVAVEIDGSSHVGSEGHVEKDRLLQRAGVHVVHILNSEITKYGARVIGALLPPEITEFWKTAEEESRDNPLSDIPF